MVIKIYKVDECFQCPEFFIIKNQKTSFDEKYCQKKERQVLDPFKIPDWCPLEDYKK